MTVVHFSGDVVFRNVRAAILDTNTDVDVVEMSAIQFKELYQHDAQVDVRIRRVLPCVQLQKRVNHFVNNTDIYKLTKYATPYQYL